MSSLIQAKDLEVHRQGKYILQNVSLSVGKKDFITIIGPNGAGKSILLECLMGTFMPDKGEIDKKNNLSIGYIPQNFNPDNSMPISVKRFLMLRKNFTPKELKSVSDETNISDVLSKNLSNLSGGELQRVLLSLKAGDSFWIPIYSDPFQHYVNNRISFIYIYCIKFRNQSLHQTQNLEFPWK